MKETFDNIDDFAVKQESYQLATFGQRFTNYIFDSFGYMILSSIIGFVMGAVMISIDKAPILGQENTLQSNLLDILIGLAVLTIYYSSLEYFFKGKTLGKLITGTRAVTEDNQRMDFQKTLVRTICRLIPFEAFSFLGEKPKGWHDTLSKTKVIVDKGWRDQSFVLVDE